MRIRIIACSVALALCLTPQIQASFDSGSISWEYQADKREAHPPNIDLVLTLPRNISDAMLCALYVNNLPSRNRGKVEVNIVVRNPSTGGQGSFRVRDDVQGNVAAPRCIQLPVAMSAGDVVTFEYKMTEFRRLKAKRGDAFTVTGNVFKNEQQATAALLEMIAAQKRKLNGKSD